MFTIAYHTVMSYFRSQRPWKHRIAQHKDLEPTLRDQSESPERLALRREDHETLTKMLASINPVQRNVIELRLAGLRGAEIAIVLGKSENAIKMAGFRAMTQLRA